MPHPGPDKAYWGYLIQQDKQPTPLFRGLLLGISHYIIKQIAPWEVKTLTPIKLANFYRLCGGNYDNLFLEVPNTTLSFIYKSLGCYHSLQPCKDPFVEPNIPALTNDGFVKWQTIQLLLNPDEHVPYLQEALRRFEIKNPYDGELFPRSLPAEALPRRPDPEMARWHESVSQQLMRESNPLRPPAAAAAMREQGPSRARGISDVESLADSVSSADDLSIVDAADYFRAGSRRPNSSGPAAAPPPRAPSPVTSPSAGSGGLAAPPSNVRRHSVPENSRSPAFDSRGNQPRTAEGSTSKQAHQPPPQQEYAFRPPAYDKPIKATDITDSRSPSPWDPHRQRTSSHSPPQRGGRSSGDSVSPPQVPQQPPRPHPAHTGSGDSLRHPSANVSPQYYGGPAQQPSMGAGLWGAHLPQSPPQQLYPYHAGPPGPHRQPGPPQPPVPLPHPAQMPQRPVHPRLQTAIPYSRAPRHSVPYSGPMQPPQRTSTYAESPTTDATIWAAGPLPNAAPPGASMPPPPPPLQAAAAVPPGMLPGMQPGAPPGMMYPPPASGSPAGAAWPGQGVRFSDGAHAASRGERMRRRTMEEMARERERQEIEYEAGRRRARGYAGAGRRSHSGDAR